MRDPLVLRYEKDEEPQQTYHRFLKLLSPIQKDILELNVRQEEKRYITVLVKLILSGERPDTIPQVMLLDDILRSNALPIFDDPKLRAGLFLTASRLNHSCIPNADHYYDIKSGYKPVFANRDIEAGEEITISYINHVNPQVLRQMELKTRGFVCRCSACDLRHPDSRVHEQRLRSIRRLYQDQDMDSSGRLKISASSSESSLKLAAKQFQKLIELLTAHPSLRKFSREAYVLTACVSNEPSL
jgi:hypothetical protein